MKSDYTPLRLEFMQRPKQSKSPAPPCQKPILQHSRLVPVCHPACDDALLEIARRACLLPVIRNEKAADPIRILPGRRRPNHLNGRGVKLKRYTIANLMFAAKFSG